MKTFKKLFTVLAIVLVAILALMPAKSFAAEGDLTITVTGEVAGRTLSVYKLFDLTVEGEGETAVYRYTWDGLASEVFFAQLTDAQGNNLGLNTVAKATDYLKGFEKDATALTNLAEEFYAFCNNEANAEALAGKTAKIGESATVAADAKNVVFTVPGEGYYLIYDETVSTVDPETGAETAVAAAMLQNVTANAEVKLKVESIVVDKTVDETTANIGDDVNFTVSTTVPNVVGYDEFFFELTDTLSKGLTFNNDVEVKIDRVTTTVPYKVNATTDATTGKTTVKITFDSTEFAKLNDKMGKDIVITYSAKLNNNAALEQDNTNEVVIEYSNDPETNEHGKTNTDIVHVYTYGFDFTKKNTAGEALNGAKFVLKLADGSYATFNENGVYTGKVANKEDATVLISEGTTTDENGDTEALGKFAVSGLEAGNYTLVEVEAPEGYSLPNFEFTFTITPELNADGTLKSVSFYYTADDNNNAANGYMTVEERTDVTAETFVLTVLNAKEGELPTTGGIGTTIFTVVGIMVMLVAGIALFARNRKND